MVLRESLRNTDREPLTDGHFEFKAWIQDKVEQTASGDASPRFLAQEKRSGERDQALDTWENLRMAIEKILEDRIVGNPDIIEGTQLAVIRKITGRLTPNISDLKIDSFHSGGVSFTGVNIGRLNLVEKIANEIARCLISHSSNSKPTDEEAFRMRSNFKPQDLFSLAEEHDCAVSQKEARDRFESGFRDDSGKIDRKRMMVHARRKGTSQKDLHSRWRVRMTIKSLLEAGVSPPRDWIWMDVWAAGLSFFPDVSKRIRKHIENDGSEALRIFKNKEAREMAGLDDDDFGLEKHESIAMRSLEKNGFGNPQGTPKRGDDLTEHKSLSLAYNIINEMKRCNLLQTEKMSESQYISYFLDGDDSQNKGRGSKQYPNILVFSEELLENVIGKSSMEDFEKGEQNAIYRWLRGEIDRWMYCPPNDHDSRRRLGGLLGHAKTSTNTSDYEMFEVQKRDWVTGEGEYDENGEPSIVKTVKCVPGKGVIDAMNSLQETQWEVNLDLLEVLCDFELDSGEVVSGVWKPKSPESGR